MSLSSSQATSPKRRGSPSGSLLTLLGIWFSVALLIGFSGLWASGVEIVGPPLVGSTMLGLAALVIMVTHTVPMLRAAVRATRLRDLVLIHALRVFGFLFLFYSGSGLPAAWAVPAAWTDVAVAVTAVPVALLATSLSSRARWVLVWV